MARKLPSQLFRHQISSICLQYASATPKQDEEWIFAQDRSELNNHTGCSKCTRLPTPKGERHQPYIAGAPGHRMRDRRSLRKIILTSASFSAGLSQTYPSHLQVPWELSALIATSPAQPRIDMALKYDAEKEFLRSQVLIF